MFYLFIFGIIAEVIANEVDTLYDLDGEISEFLPIKFDDDTVYNNYFLNMHQPYDASTSGEEQSGRRIREEKSTTECLTTSTTCSGTSSTQKGGGTTGTGTSTATSGTGTGTSTTATGTGTGTSTTATGTGTGTSSTTTGAWTGSDNKATTTLITSTGGGSGSATGTGSGAGTGSKSEDEDGQFIKIGTIKCPICHSRLMISLEVA